MDKVSHSDTYSVSSLSVTNETKDKFDELLKAARRKKLTKKKISQSKEMLLLANDDETATTASSENLLENDKVHRFDNSKNQNYILNKFFSQNNSENSVEEMKKPPIPKPRRNKPSKVVSPSSSQGTFNVTSPKIAQSISGDSSNKTYNLEVEEIGDVLIHHDEIRPKPAVRTKIKLKSNNTKQSIDDESESEMKSSIKSFRSSEQKSFNDADDANAIEMDELSEKASNSIEFTNEIKPSHKRKGKKRNESNATPEKQSESLLRTFKYEQIIEIVIHKTDKLLLNSLVVHPVVQIHIVDMNTGNYVMKSDKNRSVVFFYENNDIDYISPVMTHAYNLQEKRSLQPAWEETILLNEDYDYLIEQSRNLVAFFEIMDFVSFAMVQSANRSTKKGWHKIAFAFLKLTSPTGISNVGKKVRLQLYYPSSLKNSAGKSNSQLCEPWLWWRKTKLVKYPSTLYVTIKALLSPIKITESLRSKTPIQAERSSSRIELEMFSESKNNAVGTALTVPTELKDAAKNGSTTKWMRETYEVCKIPNNILAEFNSFEEGCLIAKFSWNGELLACGVRCDDLFFVVVYSVVTLEQVNKFPSHQGLIYDIKWAKDDTLIISASADNTVSIFGLFSNSIIPQILPHPTFVYCCDISASNDIIASGSYDGIVRIWKKKESKTEFHLYQELEAHKGYITSLCFNKKNYIYSSDSKGMIIEWTLIENNDWKMRREIFLLELKNTIINQLILYFKEKRLVINSRDCTIRIIDLKSECVLQTFYGAVNKRLHRLCSVSACGSYLFSGSENGLIQVWNIQTGDNIATYTPYCDEANQFLTINCVDCHPIDNYLVCSHLGENLPILLMNYKKNAEASKFLNVKQIEESNDASSKILKTVKMNKNNEQIHFDGNDDKNIMDLKQVLKKMGEVITINN